MCLKKGAYSQGILLQEKRTFPPRTSSKHPFLPPPKYYFFFIIHSPILITTGKTISKNIPLWADGSVERPLRAPSQVPYSLGIATEEVYIVQSVCGVCKTQSNQWKLRVHWEDPEDFTWEPINNLTSFEAIRCAVIYIKASISDGSLALSDAQSLLTYLRETANKIHHISPPDLWD